MTPMPIVSFMSHFSAMPHFSAQNYWAASAQKSPFVSAKQANNQSKIPFGSNHLDEFQTHLKAQEAKGLFSSWDKAHQTKQQKIVTYLSSTVYPFQTDKESIAITAQDVLEELVRLYKLECHLPVSAKKGALHRVAGFWRVFPAIPTGSYFEEIPLKTLLKCFKKLKSLKLITKDSSHYSYFYYITDLGFAQCAPLMAQFNAVRHELKEGELRPTTLRYDLGKLPENHPLERIKAYKQYVSSPEYAKIKAERLYSEKEDEIQRLLSSVLYTFTPENGVSKAIYGWDLLDAFNRHPWSHPDIINPMKSIRRLNLDTIEPFGALPWKGVIRPFFKTLVAMGLIGGEFSWFIPMTRSVLGELAIEKTKAFIDEVKAASHTRFSEPLPSGSTASAA